MRADGLLNLRDGEFRPARPEDFLTRSASAAFDSSAVCPLWLEFLNRVQPDPAQREALQRIAGYSATGKTGEQIAFLHLGNGANGKSTFLRTLDRVLGDYASTASPALIDRKSDSREQAYAMAELAGARFVTMSESAEDTVLAMDVLKRLTGCEPVTARRMYGQPFTFEPSCKLHLATNHPPKIRDTTHGARRRIRVIRWSETIQAGERDPDLMKKLQAERDGILNWVAEGARKYLEDRLLGVPDMAGHIEISRKDSDNIQQWLQERVTARVDFKSASAPTYQDYKVWAAKCGIDARSIQVFAGLLEQAGFAKQKNGAGNMEWRGFALRSATEVSCKESDKSQRFEPKTLRGGSRGI